LNLIQNLLKDNPNGCFGFEHFVVIAAPEGRALESCSNLSEINLYGKTVESFNNDDWYRYQILLEAGVANGNETISNLINIAGNLRNYCIYHVASYKELGQYLHEGNPDHPAFKHVNDKVLRNVAKKYAKRNSGIFYNGLYIEKCSRCWKPIYNGNPDSICANLQIQFELRK
jgi:hypothetical protein